MLPPYLTQSLTCIGALGGGIDDVVEVVSGVVIVGVIVSVGGGIGVVITSLPR